MDVREVVVHRERAEDRSETEVRAEGGRGRGRDGYGCEVAKVAAEGGMSGGGRNASRAVREREERLAECVVVKTGKLTAEGMGEGVEPCEAKLPTELRGWETGRSGTLGGCGEDGGGGGGGGCLVTTGERGFPVAVAFGDEEGMR